MTRYIKLVSQAINAANQYYGGTPVMSDSAYDKLINKIGEIEKEVKPIVISPTQSVMGRTGNKKHVKKMYSLKDVFEVDPAVEFLGEEDVIGTDKLDGISLECVYLNGILTTMVTRGDGISGADVTKHKDLFSNIPSVITEQGLVSVYGEVVMTTKEFERYNKTLDNKLSNPRNTVAGIINSNVSKEEVTLLFIAYDTNNVHNVTYSETLNFLKKKRFTVPDILHSGKIIHSELTQLYNDQIKKRVDKEWVVDGIVFRINNNNIWETKGFTRKYPRGSIALKYPPSETWSTITAIEISMSVTGELIPTAIILPVEVDNTVIRKVSLYNYNIITTLNYKIGMKVKVIKSGDIIPKIIDSVPTDGESIVVPEVCPFCGVPTNINDNIPTCINPDCPEVLVAKITKYGSRGHMDIMFLGTQTVRYLVDSELVKQISDLYSLSEETVGIKDVPGYSRLLESIENSKGKPLDVVLGSLSIPYGGRHRFKSIVDKYGMDTLTISISKIGEVFGIGKHGAISIHNYLSNNKDEIADIIRLQNTPIPTVLEINDSDSRVTFTITGIPLLDNKPIKRSAAINLLKKFKLHFVKRVTNKTNYLVAEEPTGQKHENAIKLGVEIITLSNLIKRLKGNNDKSIR